MAAGSEFVRVFGFVVEQHVDYSKIL